MSLISAGSISLDSTFKEEFTMEQQYLKEDLSCEGYIESGGLDN